MRSVRTLTILWLCVAWLGCKGGNDADPSVRARSSAETSPAASPAPSQARDAADAKPSKLVVKMTEFKNKMCACKDASCLDRVRDEMNAFSNARAVEPSPEALSQGDDQDQLVEITKQLQDCVTKVLSQ